MATRSIRPATKGMGCVMSAPDREKALGIALAQIEKQYGKGSIMRLGDEGRAPVEVIPTGSIALDVALGIGGLPRGRVVEIYGPDSSGKTTVTLHAVASVQAAGGIAAFIDAEHALDPEYAKALGVDTDSLLVSQPETGGKALKFYASVRLYIRRIEALKDGTDVVGNRTRVKVVKNKMAPPFKQAEFDIIYGQGISREGSLIDVGVEQGLIRKAGAWYTYDGEQLGQGKENVRTFLRENPDIANEVEKRIKEKLGVGPRIDADDEPVPAPVDF